MNNIEKLFDDLKSGHYEDIDIYLDKAIKEYNQATSALLKIELFESKKDKNFEWLDSDIQEIRIVAKLARDGLNKL